MSIETPKYVVLDKDGSFEVRRYAPNITATVEVEGDDYREAANNGFRPLATYIFGGNTSRQEIAMTAPVTAQPTAEKIAMTAPVTITKEKTYLVSFTMPSKYSMENLPLPKNPNVRFQSNPAKKVAAIRFAGTFKQRNFDKNLKRLREWMKQKRLTPNSEPVIAGYDPPIKPWFLKHNEILIEVQ